MHIFTKSNDVLSFQNMLSCFMCAPLESFTCDIGVTLIVRKKQRDTVLRFGCLDTIHLGCTWFTGEGLTPTLTLSRVFTKCFLINDHVIWWLQMVWASDSIYQGRPWIVIVVFVLCLPFGMLIINFTNPCRMCLHVNSTNTTTSSANILRLSKGS